MLLEKESKGLKQHKRLLTYHKILTSLVKCFPLEQKEKFEYKKQSPLKTHVTLCLRDNGLRVHIQQKVPGKHIGRRTNWLWKNYVFSNTGKK